MGTVLDLRLRQPASGDWTSLERSQLYALVDQLPADPGREVALGVTDAGDPWFVVISSSDEVELHVARIGGRFVIHRGDEERVSEAADLWTAAARAGGLGLPERRATVTSLFGDPLPVHALAALETPAFDGAAPWAESPAPQPTTAAAVATTEFAIFSALAPEADARPVVSASTTDLPLPPVEESVRAPLLVEAAAPAPVSERLMLTPTAAVPVAAPVRSEAAPLEIASRATALAGGETLVGAGGADTLIGGAGDDLIDGSGAAGGFDLIDGRGGDDRLMLKGSVIAIGGTGKDAFLVAPRAPGNFGIVLDFFESRDDHLEFAPGSRVKIIEVTPEADVLKAVRGLTSVSNAPAVPGARVTLDVNGDGHADGFVLLANTHGWSAGENGLRQPTSTLQPPAEDSYAQLFSDTSLVGMEARTMQGHGPSPVLTAYEMGPGFFGEHHELRTAAVPLLHPADITPPSAIDLFA